MTLGAPDHMSAKEDSKVIADHGIFVTSYGAPRLYWWNPV